MRIIQVLVMIVTVGACAAGSYESIVGLWQVTENVSDQVHEMEFRDDGTLRQTVRGETNFGRYAVSNVGRYPALEITWNNGSKSSSWILADGINSMTLYHKRSDDVRGLESAFRLATLSRPNPE